FGQRVEVRDDFVPVEKFAVDADLVAKPGLGSRRGGEKGDGPNQRGEKCARDVLHAGDYRTRPGIARPACACAKLGSFAIAFSKYEIELRVSLGPYRARL